MEGEQEGVPGSSGEDKDRTEKCECDRCSECRVSNQGFKHNTVKNIKSIVKDIIWPEEIKRLVLVFGHEQETVEAGRIKARGHLAKVTLGTCRVQFKEEIQREDEITVLEDASGLIYGIQQRNPDCTFEEMVKIRLVVNRDEVTAVKHRKDLRDWVIDCTDHNELIWVMQGTDWSHYRGKGLVAGKETPMSKWLDKMEALTGEVEDLYGVSLLWRRDRNKHMLMEELLCPVINKITPEINVCIKEFYKQRQRANPDYESNDTVECCRVDGRTVPRLWTQPRVQEHKGKGSSTVRLLMWNPENLAQRLDLDKAVAKGKQTRMNSPPLRSVREEWTHKIRIVDPEFIIYNEASLGGTDTKKKVMQGKSSERQRSFIHNSIMS